MNTTRHIIARTEAVATHGMVNSKHPLAAQAGLDVLKAGGNAVDAAITTALAQGVVEPMMSGVGGGGFMLYHEAKTGRTHVLDYFMRAPRRASADMYEVVDPGKVNVLGFGGVKDDANASGYRAIGVPGTLAGAAAALERFGTLSLARALEPAIAFAEHGFESSWHHSLQVVQAADTLARFPASAQIFLRNGQFAPRAPGPAAGDMVVQADLAATLKRVAAEGPAGFYRGEIARRIAADFAAHGNLIDERDLADYRAEWAEPRSTSHKGHTLLFAPNTGGSTLSETFNILEGLSFAGLQANDPDALHLFIEAARIAYADRFAWLADERMVDVPYRVLESKSYAAQRRTGIDPARAAATVAAWGGRPPGAGEPDGGCTTHLSVIDSQRNMVAITQTINAAWGSGVVVPGTGVLFNNTMVLFDPNPGRKNSIAGGKYPLSSMTPTLVLKDGRPFMSAGAPGGRQIMGTVMRTIHNVIEFGLGPAAACANLSVDASAARTVIDADLGDAVINDLRARGHDLDPREKSIFPRVFASPTAIVVDGDTLRGGADPYHVGVAVGW